MSTTFDVNPQFTHWSRWDDLPPTSAEEVEHG